MPRYHIGVWDGFNRDRWHQLAIVNVPRRELAERFAERLCSHTTLEGEWYCYTPSEMREALAEVRHP